MPPLSMWLASVTSLDQTSNCHLTRPSTPQCTRPVWMPTRMFTFTAITSRTRLSERGSRELREGVKRVPHYKSHTIQSHNLHCSIVCGLCCVLFVCVCVGCVLMCWRGLCSYVCVCVCGSCFGCCVCNVLLQFLLTLLRQSYRVPFQRHSVHDPVAARANRRRSNNNRPAA